MALQVWLPLNGTLENKGLSNVTVTNHGTTVDNNGKIGKCYSFDGSNDYIDISKTAGSIINNVEGFSVSIWYCHITNRTWARLFELHNNVMETGSGTKACLLLGTGPNGGQISVAGRYNGNTGGGMVDTSIKNFNTNVWTLYTVTVSPTTIKVYENSNLIKTLTLTVNMCSLNYTKVWLGRSTWSSD